MKEETIEEQWIRFKNSDEFKKSGSIKQAEYYNSFCIRKMMRDEGQSFNPALSADKPL